MTFANLLNAMRILLSIDRHELVDADVIPADDGAAWHAFRTDPFRWFIRADDASAAKLWRIIERRSVRVSA